MAQEREESQGFFEMLWDCDHCDTKGLLAKSQRFCANCGGPQNPAKRYFPPPGSEVRVDGHKFEGADRVCPACSSPMGAMARNCTHCGSPLDGSAEVRGVMSPQAGPPPKPARKKRRIWPIVVLVLFVVAFGVWFRCVRSQSATVTVASHAWKRTVAVEEFNERNEENWRNMVPPDASSLACYDKQRSSRQVADGEECHMERRDKKDGTFEQVKKCAPKYRSEPVMDSWCRYMARKWRTVDELRASGTGLSPTWPANIPPAQVTAQFGARREGKRTETLTLNFQGHGSCDVSDAIWRKYSDGQKAKVSVRASSGDVVCDSL